MCALYDPTKKIIYIIYLDANNLYGWAMSQGMPIGGFKWLTREEFERIDWLAQKDDQDLGYIVVCDLDYPPELHDRHNDYPLAPERLQVNYTWLSQKQMEINRCYNMSRSSKTIKLMPNLMNKREYICDYTTLQLDLQEGMILKKIHRVIQYNQSQWLKKYIHTNQELRVQAKNDHEKNLFKLMNNSVYGKTCENLKKRTDIKLVQTEEKRKKYTEMPHCQNFRIFAENLAGIQLEKSVTKIDKPTAVGFKTLECSKLLMQRFMYKKLKVWYGDKVKLLFTDTDSFMLEIETEDVYKDFFEHKEFFDFSNYPVGSPFRDTSNQMVVGKFKDETNGEPIVEFVGLRPKMYSYTVLTDHGISEKHRAKGIASATSKNLLHEQYVAQLNNPRENYLPNRRFDAQLHQVYSKEVDKRALCSFDDKRFLLADGIFTIFYLCLVNFPVVI